MKPFRAYPRWRPLNAWRLPAFEPMVRGENLYGRGAADDKGQLSAHVKALECYLRTVGELPVNAVSRPGRFSGFTFLHPAHEVPLGGGST